MLFRSHNTEDLDPIAKINIMMDNNVGVYIDELINDGGLPNLPHKFPSQQISIQMDNIQCVTHVPPLLTSRFYEFSTKKHFRNVVKLPVEHYDSIDWESIRLALTKNEHMSQYIKYIHSQWNTMTICQRWQSSGTSTCPVCRIDNEDWKHVLQCTDSNMSRVRNESLTLIKNTLTLMKTNEMLQYHLMYIIMSWTNNVTIYEPGPSAFFPGDDIKSAHVHQSEIGFDLFFKGLLSPKWAAIQENDYIIRRLPRQYNIVRWKKNFTTQLLRHATAMWNERCTIVQALNDSTYEIRSREQAWQYCKQLSQEKWRIPHDSYYLLNRTEYYFQTTNMLNIKEWNANIATAIARGSSQLSVYQDIRKFFPISKKSRGQLCRPTTKRLFDIVRSTGLKIQQTISSFFSRLKN